MAKDENGNVFFDDDEQAEVNRVIQERLARAERKAPDDYEDLKGIAEAAKQYGFTGTPAEIRQQMRQQAENQAAERELEELERMADERGISPELQKQINALQKKVDGYEAERQATQQQRDAAIATETAIQAQFRDFAEKYPNVDINELDNDQRFLKFAKGRHTTLAETYADYLDVVGDVESSTAARRQSKQDRTTTGGSGTGGSTFGLTENQIRLARESGISLKKYAENLALIKR